MVIARQAPEIYPIPFCSRFDSVLFTPKPHSVAFREQRRQPHLTRRRGGTFGGASMATTERKSNESDPVHDFAWHRTHRARRGGQLIDIVTLAGWAALVGWVLLLH
jgi:hypothetical protein